MNKRWFLSVLLVLLFVFKTAVAESFTVSDIRLEGLERIPDGTLLNYLPVHIGDVFDDNQTAYAMRELYKTGFFKDVQLFRDGTVLVVRVIERPAIADVKFDGNNDIEDEQLEEILKDIGIVKGRVFNPSALDKIEQGLKQQAYYAGGKYAVRIETKVTELEQNRVNIEINISEGVIARIKQINIIGNEVFDDEKLLSELQLGIPGFWSFFSSIDEYAKPKLAADLETLKSYYQDRGYIRFNIDSTQVSITPDKKDIYITINVTEGKQYFVKDIKLAGNLIVKEEELRALLLIKAGALFSRKEMTEAKDLITRKLGNEGYAFAKVNVIPEINDTSREVSLTYFIDPGKKVYVRRINFFGNYKTKDEVLRREMRLMEGGELSNSKLERSKIRLQRLAFVEEVEIDKEPIPGTDDLVDVNINITERLSGSFNIGAGYSQTQGFVFNLGLQMENLFGTGQKLSLNFNNDDANKVYSVSFTDPYYTVDGISRSFNFNYRERDAAEEDINNFLSNIYGASVVYGIPLTEYDSIALGFGYEHTQILRGALTVSSDDVISFLNTCGEGVTDTSGNYLECGLDALTLTASYTHDTRNRTVFANQGSSQSVILDMTAPGSDLEYYKLTYRTKFYFPIVDEWTLMLKTDIAYGDGYGDNESLPFYERFYAGGLRTVRGFDSNSLGPRDICVPPDTCTNDPRGGDLRTVASAEFIFPVPFMEKPPRSVRFSAFYDIGNVFLHDEDLYDFDKDELRSSIGVSFVWLAPIGPLQFSWARPVEKQDGDNTQGFQFSIGSFF
ncbi:MAG TPA: outer membrane protein assembly factor BamA [Gammaproteobacteria bacterium]